MQLFEAYFRSTPWALPLTGSTGVFLLPVVGRLGARLALRPWLVWCLGVSIAGYMSVTVTPSPDAGFWGGGRYWSWSVTWPLGRDLFMMSSETLNVWLAVPLGLTTMLAAWRGRWALLSAPLLLPPAAEVTQWLLPGLGRSAFLLSDVTANWTGCLIGAFVGTVIAVTVPRLGRPEERNLDTPSTGSVTRWLIGPPG